ncbi:methionine--tRNA ligase subunit beta [Candidatus Geothermarchaeota archaeon]|nr:MAG: methionine--tRNA ligase subunit beta [Candidatus Geothermarchaeota archaeon]
MAEKQISLEEFKKIVMRIGTVVEAEEIPKSRTLIKMKVDFGNGEIKQAVAGLKGYYFPDELIGKQFVFVTNLKPAKLMGEISEVMILAAVGEGEVVLIKPERSTKNGLRVE